jgi:uncharacterized membrane protein YsdA (DUF1294 family)/cold shock CspA family protein
VTNVLGKVVLWKHSKGYGFIQPHDGSARRFFHARDFDDGDNGRPRVGDWVRFAPGQDARGRPTATTVRPAVARRGHTAMRTRRSRRPGHRLPLLGWLAWLGWLTGLGWLLKSGQLRQEGLAAVAIASVLTCIVYAVDKRAAERRRRRVPEHTLHLLELIGGWPGAFLAQRMFHHKRSKRSYLLVFWMIGVLQVAGAWLWTQGLLPMR